MLDNISVTEQTGDKDRPLIEVVDVSKRFRLQREYQRSFQEVFIRFWKRRRHESEYFWPLRDVSLQVCPGDSIGILGQNGSGKSTLLKVITGVLPPTSGQVNIRGRIASLLELGAGFHPDLTGRENVFLNGSIYGMSSDTIRSKMDQIIEFAEIGDFIDTPVKHYSSGMYVRLGFSVAIHTEPEVMIIDEVLTVGDQVFQQKCMQRILEMKAAGVAIILVSHSIEDIRRLCNRAIWLHGGSIRAGGASSDVVDEYLLYSQNVFYAKQRSDNAEVSADASDIHHRRWGTYQAEIVQVELCDADGNPLNCVQHGGTLCVRLHYVVHEPIHKPAFGVAIYRQDGAHVNGPNSFADGYPLEVVDGTGVMEYWIDQVPLNPGRFELTAAIYSHDLTVAFDHHHRMYPFDVVVAHGRGEDGVVHIPARWNHSESSVAV